MHVPNIEITDLRSFGGGDAADVTGGDGPGTAGADWEGKVECLMTGGGGDAVVEGTIDVDGRV